MNLAAGGDGEAPEASLIVRHPRPMRHNDAMCGACDEPPERAGETAGPPAIPRSISSHELLGNARVLIIRHGESDYRLQLTSGGKLILTK